MRFFLRIILLIFNSKSHQYSEEIPIVLGTRLVRLVVSGSAEDFYPLIFFNSVEIITFKHKYHVINNFQLLNNDS